MNPLPSAVGVGPGFKSPVCWCSLSSGAVRLIRWETLESNFQKWQSDSHDRSDSHDKCQRRPDIRQSADLTKAASRAPSTLHRVPSNISTRVRQLDESVGAQLFVRDKQRLFLSPSGEHLLGYADRLLRLSAEALGAVSKAPPRGVLRLGSLERTAVSRLLKVLAAYHKAYPDVRVELITGTNDALTAAVLERRIEAAFVAEVPSSKELVAERLFRERLVVISSLRHASIRRPQGVDGDSVITFPSGCAYRRVLQHGSVARGSRPCVSWS